MKNSKGFTLVELLAMLVVLAVLMAVAVPNVNGILKNQRDNTLIEDAGRFIEQTKTAMTIDSKIGKPAAGECLVFTLQYVDFNKEIAEGANSKQYKRFDSIVVYTRVGNEYKYYVRLIESGDNLSIPFSEESVVSNYQKQNEETKEQIIKVDDKGEQFSNDASSITADKINDLAGSTICTSIKDVYLEQKAKY